MAMSIESYIVADHLNKIRAGRGSNLVYELPRSGFQVKKLALKLVCMGMALSKADSIMLGR